MIIILKRIAYILLAVVSFTSCLEPYEINIEDYEDLLVVDALITDELKNHKVILSRSTSTLNQTPKRESGALVIITDEEGYEEVLTEIEPGVYETDMRQFLAHEGVSYVLSIQTVTGEKYTSKPCLIQPKTVIEDIHYLPGKDWNEDQSQEFQGLRVLVDGTAQGVNYVRWMYEETWMFKVPYPTQVEYDYDELRWQYISPINVLCWKDSKSNSILIHSSAEQRNAEFFDKQVCFIPTSISDKLTVRYSILVKQLSISKDEYEFWKKLKFTTEDSGDPFGIQPYSIIGNIRNVINKNEPVLGYFQTASVVSKRIYINRDQIEKLNLPIMEFNYGCQLNNFYLKDSDYGSALDMYEGLVLNGSFSLFDAIYEQGSIEPAGLMLSSPRCSDCTKTGTLLKPDFWND